MRNDIHCKSWQGFKVTVSTRAAMKPETFVWQGTMAYCVQAGQDGTTEIRPISWTRSRFTHTPTHTHRAMMCQGQLTRPHLCAVCLPAACIQVYFASWSSGIVLTLPTGSRKDVSFRHLLEPSVDNIKSCQGSFYTVTSTESTEWMPEQCHCLCKCLRNRLIFTLSSNTDHFQVTC